MDQKSEAITLRTYPFSEADKIVLFLTPSIGLLRGVAYGAKKSKSRFGASLEPLTYLKVAFRRKEQQDLAVIQNCEIIRALPAYELSWERQLHISYFAELLSEFAKEQVESEKLFRLTLATLDAMERVPIDLLARYFEFWLLRLEGVLPALNRILSDGLAEKTLQVLKSPPGSLGEVSFNREELGQLESAASKLIEYHLEKPLRAKKVLKDLLGN